MRRVREESSETYEVSAAEICQALGIHYSELDLIEIKKAPTTGNRYNLTVSIAERVDVELVVADNRGWLPDDNTPIGFVPVNRDDNACGE